MYLKLLEKGISYGRITLKLPHQETHRFGDSGPAITWIIHGQDTLKKIAQNWEFELGETYVNGEWDVEDGSLYTLISILRQNFGIRKPPWPVRQMAKIRHAIRHWNPLHASRKNVSHHYDLDGTLFSQFLDENQIYSCAYFKDDDVDLDQAQRDKCQHIARKLLLQPGQSVLDIGCGWGGLALYLAQHFDVHVTGITLSREQYQVARRRARDAQLEDKLDFKLKDYRELDRQYDRVVSIGMFEHVGRDHYATYFDQVASSLTETGIALMHTIARTDRPRETNPWIEKYIFPGGYLPALSEISTAAEASALQMTDIEILGGHYERTLAHWRQRFLANRDRFSRLIDDRFCRMWEFYLASSEAAFRHTRIAVMQVQLARHRDAVPLTRDYMYHTGPTDGWHGAGEKNIAYRGVG